MGARREREIPRDLAPAGERSQGFGPGETEITDGGVGGGDEMPATPQLAITLSVKS